MISVADLSYPRQRWLRAGGGRPAALGGIDEGHESLRCYWRAAMGEGRYEETSVEELGVRGRTLATERLRRRGWRGMENRYGSEFLTRARYPFPALFPAPVAYDVDRQTHGCVVLARGSTSTTFFRATSRELDSRSQLHKENVNSNSASFEWKLTIVVH